MIRLNNSRERLCFALLLHQPLNSRNRKQPPPSTATYMNPLIIGAAVIVILMFNSAMNKNPAAQACAQEILALLKQTPDAKAKDIAAIMAQHQRTRADAGQVTTLVKTGLKKTGIIKNDRPDVMIEVRKAKMLLTE
jgi:ADP-ribosylglycohydrolase